MNIFERYPNSRFLKNLHDSDLLPLRAKISDLFQFLDGLEDPHFEQQLDQDPHARLWEMLLAKILKSEGYQPKSANRGPDFVVERDGRKIFIEAICPGPGMDGNPNSVPPTIYGASIAQTVPVEAIVLHIRAALKEKKQKYAQYFERGIVSDHDGCIIAVCSSKIDRAAGLWPPVIMRATLGLGNSYEIFGPGEGFVGEGIESCEHIAKANGEAIDTTFLLSEDNNLISGVLYSDCSFFTRGSDPFRESVFLHNPKARVPLNPGFFTRIKEIWTIYCHGGSQWRSYKVHDAQHGLRKPCG